MNPAPDRIEQQHTQLKALLRSMGHVLVAFSGGVDSTLVLKVATTVPGLHVLAATAVSATSPQHEHEAAVALARQLGVHHIVIPSHEMDLPEFTQNAEDKCYVCKQHRFTRLQALARQYGCRVIVDGSNLDDQKDYRPGLKALQELGIRSPLAEAAMTKAAVRDLSRQLGLSTWEKPALACLASRIPYYEPITAAKLNQVDRGEIFLRGLNFDPRLRVRHHGDTARLEMAPADFEKLVSEACRHQIVDFFKALGFSFVALDLEGYGAGRLNRILHTSE